MDGADVETRTIKISEAYRIRLRQLLSAAGYDATRLKDEKDDHYLKSALGDLADFIAQSDLFYPEEIASAFITWRAEKAGGPHQHTMNNVDVNAVIADIVKAGFFNDSGVESYASPCTPMVLGLTEIATQAQASRADTRFVLGSTDICNLTGLNKMIPDRNKTAPFLAQMIHRPREEIKHWAADHGYRVETMIVRAGGDEFKYIHRFRTLDGSAIDSASFDTQIAKLQQEMMEQNRAFSRVCGVAGIAHHKVSVTEKRRSPGVLNTMAMRALAPENPDIQHMMIELGADIALIREIMDANPSPTEQKSPDMFTLPTRMPLSHHKIDAVDPYRGSPVTPNINESIEHHYLRQALGKAGFHDLAALDDIFTYHPKKRWSELNTQHPEYLALNADAQLHVRRVTDAEHMRGVIDPVSRNYSQAFRHKCEERAKQQDRRKAVLVHLHNLSGMNSVDDTFGDAVLREVGNVIDRAYDTIIVNGIADQKPLVVRRGGGEFMVFLDSAIHEDVAYEFGKEIQRGITALNDTPIRKFAAEHRVDEKVIAGFFAKRKIDEERQSAYSIDRIPYPIEPAFGMNRGLAVDITGEELKIEKPKGGAHGKTGKWQIRTGELPAVGRSLP